MKPKQVHKSKDELLADLRKNAEFQKKMKFAKEVFYPALIKATTSIEDAMSNLSIINSVILEKFLAKMKETTMKEIDIYTNLSPENPKYNDLKAMLNLFDEMSIFEAKEQFEAMRNEISLFLNEEQKVRSLETLPTRWLDEL